MKDNRRLYLLILLAIVLFVIYLEIQFLKPKPVADNFEKQLLDKEKVQIAQAKSAISRIRQSHKEKEPLSIMDIKSPTITIFLKDMNCKYLSKSELNLLENTEMDTILQPGTLLLNKAFIKKPPFDSFYFCTRKQDGKALVYPNKRSSADYRFTEVKHCGLINLFDDLSSMEILLSVYFGYSNLRRSDFMGIRSNQIIYDLIMNQQDGIEADRTYTIYTMPEYTQTDSLYEIKGSSILDLFEYDQLTQINSRQVNDKLMESLIYNDDIPFELKNQIIVKYISYYFIGRERKEKPAQPYFAVLLKCISDYPHGISKDYNGILEIDQYAINNAFRQAFEYGNIYQIDFMDFCEAVLSLSQNPRTVLRAYTGIAYSKMKFGKQDEAREIALKAYEIYKEPYYQDVDEGLLNTQAIVSYIMFHLDHGVSEEAFLEDLKYFKENTDDMEGFNNYLAYIDAIAKDLSASPPDSVIAAYKKVDATPSHHPYFRGKGDYTHKIYGPYFATTAIKELEKNTPEEITVDYPFYAKKFLISPEKFLMNEEGTMQLKIIQNGLPVNESSAIDKRLRNWKKAIINNEIYWIKIWEIE